MRVLRIFLSLLLATACFGNVNVKPLPGMQFVNRTHRLGRGLVGIWVMNERSGVTVFDLSGNGNTGVFAGSTVAWTAGDSGPALNFSGATPEVTIGYKPSLEPAQITVIARIRAGAQNQTYAGIATKDEGAAFSYRLQGHAINTNVAFGVTTTNGAKTSPVKTGGLDGNWHTIAGTYDLVKIRFYYDAIEAATGTAETGAIVYAQGPLKLGESWVATLEYTGDMSWVMIFSRALTAGEIALLCRKPFCMLKRDNVAMMTVEVPAPAGGGQVIIIQTAKIVSKMIPFLLLIPAIILIKGRKCQQR